MRSLICVMECGCKIPLNKTAIKAIVINGVRKTTVRVCNEHNGQLLHKTAICPKCKNKLTVKPRTNRKKCKCGHLICIVNGDPPKPKKKRRTGYQLVKDCIFCGNDANAVNKDNLCTTCGHEYNLDQINIALFDRFARKVLLA